MGKTAVVVDTYSGILKEESEKTGIFIQPMPFYIDDELFYESVNLTHDKFYEKQASNAKITTSMPLVGDVLDKWNEILKDYDEIVYIPMPTLVLHSSNSGVPSLYWSVAC